MAFLINSNGELVLVGSADADTLNATNPATDTTLFGLAGDDIYVIDGPGDVVVEDPGSGIDTVKSSISYTIAPNVENVILTGSSNINAIGNELNNSLTGNDDNNILDGKLGNDTMAGGVGNDTYDVDSALDVVTEASGAGLDLIRASISYTLSANVENLLLTGSANINGTGNLLNNDVAGNTGNNILIGLGGNDVMHGDAGDDVMDGGDGDDHLYGDAGNDALTGGAGNDYLEGGLGNDSYNGGAGNDYYFVGVGDKPIVEAAGGGDDTVDSDADWTLESNVENLILRPASGAIKGTGNALNNHLIGNGNNNTLTGNAGNDTLDGRAGADTLIGGQGNDTYVVDDPADKVTELGGLGEGTADKVITSLDFYRLAANIENLQLAGSANSTGYGNELDNNLLGNAGDNTLFGFDGNDTLNGGPGGDHLFGGKGNDTYYFDDNGDFALEHFGEGTDTIMSGVEVDMNSMLNIENVTLTGAMSVDVFGNSLSNTINGNAGNNLIDGGGGIDTMAGGLGDDRYVVDRYVAGTPALSDSVVEGLNGGYDTVYAYVTYVLGANVEKLVLGNVAGAINGTGNALDNVIVGNPSNNVIDGGLGNDNITGGGGDDTLTGGAGNDTLDGGTGQDGMSGGVGDDIYYVDNALDTVNELALSGTDLVRSAISFDLSAAPVAGVSNVQNVENLTLLGANSIDGTGNALNNILTGNDGANILLGNGGNDTLNGGLGTDTLAGGAGDDVMDGGAGADSMSGGLGNDTFVVDNAGDIVTEVAGEGIDTIKSGITFDMNANGANVENLTLVGPGNLDATGNALNNTLVGNDGDNRLDGGAGNDTMRGGKGNDTYVVDNASDVVTELLNEGIDKVEVRYSTVVTYNIGVNIEIVQLDDGTGPAASNLAFNAVGNALDNEIVGNSANNNLDGGLGNDVLMGGAGDDTMTGGAGSDAFDVDDNLSAGNDTMSGGAGDDFYVVNSAGDVIVEPVSSGTDRVESSINFNMGISAPNVEILYLDIQSGSINGTGNALDNTIYGNQQDNVIQGGAGDDTFYLMAYDIDFTPWASLDPNNPIEHNTGATLTGNDTIEGGTTGADSGTNDQLFADVADLTGPAGALHVHGVEHITLYSATTVAGSNTIDATDITGASDITVRDRSGDGYSPADMSITNLATGVTIKATDFHNDLNIARATDTGNDTQNITLNAFSGALNTSSIENVDLHIVQPSDGSDTDVDMSGATGVQHLSLTGASGDVNLHMPAGSDLKLQNGSMGVHVLDNALTSLTVHLDNVTAGLETDSALTSLDLDTSGSGGPSALNAGGSGAPLINVTGTQSLSLLVQNQDVDASGLSGGLFVGAGGSNAAVSLTGGSGDDDLNGGTGADRLNGGGAGIDHLSGDQGADTFVFNHAPNGTDFSFIHDFDDGTDKLELDSSVFTGLTAGGTLAADEFFKGDPGDASAVAGATGAHILFEANSGNLYYDNDAAAGGEKLFANIWHGNNIEHTDIQVV